MLIYTSKYSKPTLSHHHTLIRDIPVNPHLYKWSYNGELFFMDGLPFEIDGEFIKKKSGKNVFLMKTAFAEFYFDFDYKKQVASTFGIKFESGCF